jgi:hypothetical protein
MSDSNRRPCLGRSSGREAAELPIRSDLAQALGAVERIENELYTSNSPLLTLRSTRSEAPAALIGATPANCQSAPTGNAMEAVPVSRLLLML